MKGDLRLTFADVARQSTNSVQASNSHGGYHHTNYDHHRHSRDYLGEDSDSPPLIGRDKSMVSMERELRSSVAKLYQNYDFVTDEYDRLYEIIDKLREDYNNSKQLFIYSRYKEFKRIIKNALRQWRAVEKKSTLAMSRKTTNTNYSMALKGSLNRLDGGMTSSSLGSINEQNTFSHNLDARLKAQNNTATRDLYAECTRLEREIFQYKSRNQQIKNLLCKLAESYENSKAHVLHIWGRFKELRSMIREIIYSDV